MSLNMFFAWYLYISFSYYLELILTIFFVDRSVCNIDFSYNFFFGKTALMEVEPQKNLLLIILVIIKIKIAVLLQVLV